MLPLVLDIVINLCLLEASAIGYILQKQLHVFLVLGVMVTILHYCKVLVWVQTEHRVINSLHAVTLRDSSVASIYSSRHN